RSSGHRSSPLRVEAVPSVIESPKATIATVSSSAITSSASRKYQDVVELGNATSPRSAPCEPELGALMYEGCIPLECQVIDPLLPTTWKLTASFRPSSAKVSTSSTKSRSTGSLQTSCPGWRVTLRRCPNVTLSLVRGTIAPALACRPM